ncbi:hypothetical protein ERJ75_001697900 [Trypanosoma vivax]|nr:hypothetical protein ERJ75_001697900 [Trypanosoma vivax]
MGEPGKKSTYDEGKQSEKAEGSARGLAEEDGVRGTWLACGTLFEGREGAQCGTARTKNVRLGSLARQVRVGGRRTARQLLANTEGTKSESTGEQGECAACFGREGGRRQSTGGDREESREEDALGPGSATQRNEKRCSGEEGWGSSMLRLHGRLSGGEKRRAHALWRREWVQVL